MWFVERLLSRYVFSDVVSLRYLQQMIRNGPPKLRMPPQKSLKQRFRRLTKARILCSPEVPLIRVKPGRLPPKALL
jgi:hypothetical protein